MNTQTGDQLRSDVYQQYSQLRKNQGANPNLQAAQGIASGNQGLWGTAQQEIQKRLSPGYSAYGPEHQSAQYNLMQGQINQNYDQQRQRELEQLNSAGLYRSGLAQAALQHDVEQPRQLALQNAATQAYLSGQNATQQNQSQALADALGLGGQQLSSLLNLYNTENVQPLQTGAQLYSSIYGPYEENQRQLNQQQQQATAGNVLNLATTLLPILLGA